MIPTVPFGLPKYDNGERYVLPTTTIMMIIIIIWEGPYHAY